MPLSDIVTITISQDSVGVAHAGFGVPLVLSANASWSERTRRYSSASEVGDDFATDSPEYLAASAIFSQSPHPKELVIGRSALPPTLVYVIGVSVIRDNHVYQVNVKGEGVTATEAETAASDGSATNDEIVALIVTALNNVVGNNYTAAATGSVGSKVVTVTADNPGDWFALEVDPDLTVKMTHIDPGVATDLSAIQTADDDWYALYTLYNSNAYVLAAAAWVEARKKIYIAEVPETEAVTTAVGNSDTLDDLHTLAYARTAGLWHPIAAEMAGAAWLGKVLPKEPGSETWAFKRLAGISPSSLTTTQITNLKNRKANWYYTVAGVNITSPTGYTADGNYIDVARGLDWVEDDMATAVFGLLAGADKVPYTDPGVAQVEAEVRGSLKRAVSRGIFAEDPAFVVTVPLVADVSASDKAARHLPDVKWSATLAGAVHSVDVTGVVSV